MHNDSCLVYHGTCHHNDTGILKPPFLYTEAPQTDAALAAICSPQMNRLQQSAYQKDLPHEWSLHMYRLEIELSENVLLRPH